MNQKISTNFKLTDKIFYEKNYRMFYATYFNEKSLIYCVFFDYNVYRLLLQKQNSSKNNSNFSQYFNNFIKDEKIRKFRINRKQVAKIIKENTYYYAKMNNYFFMKNKNYCRINHEIINSITKLRHEKIKCIWQSNNSSSKKTLMNKNEFKTISKNFFKLQSQLNSFFWSKNFSSAHIITSLFNLHIANNLNITQ